jgi:DNA repair protein RadC
MNKFDVSDTEIVKGPLIANMEKSERPREKMLHQGIDSLSDAELLALLFGTGIQGKSVVDLSEEILRDNNYELSRILKLSVAEIRARYKGIGEVKAITLKAALELGQRAAKEAPRIKSITSSDDIYNLMKGRLEWLDNEEIWVLYLNRANRVIYEQKHTSGGISQSVADIKMILKGAIEHLASGIILVHNHPSGNAKPSNEDNRLTAKLKDAAKLVDVNLLDHVIIYPGGHFSYLNEGML